MKFLTVLTLTIMSLSSNAFARPAPRDCTDAINDLYYSARKQGQVEGKLKEQNKATTDSQVLFNLIDENPEFNAAELEASNGFKAIGVLCIQRIIDAEKAK